MGGEGDRDLASRDRILTVLTAPTLSQPFFLLYCVLSKLWRGRIWSELADTLRPDNSEGSTSYRQSETVLEPQGRV